MEASYCNTENMSWFDKTSRLDTKFCNKMNTELLQLGLTQWQQDEPTAEAVAISDWLPNALDSILPMLAPLIHSLDNVEPLSHLPEVTLTSDDILSKPDLR